MAPHADEPTQVVAESDTTTITVPDPVTTKDPTQSFISTSKPWDVSSILPHRKTCPPMAKGVAAFGSADMFKSPHNAQRPLAKRWETRITPESAARKPSSLKAAMKYFNPETISLCGGLPSSEYFPYESITFKVPTPDAFSEQNAVESGSVLTAGKYDVRNDASQYDLSIALNYGQSMGPPQLMRFVTEHTELVHSPPYQDWDICITIGSTSALEISLRMFCQRGDYLLAEEYAFSSAIETALPMGIHPVGIKMDHEGLLPSHLDSVLSNWDESARGAPKPFVLYTVPTGQNPTGYTQPLSRRKEIYAVAQKHDLLILEDEPYYFLQMEPYVSGHTHSIPSPFTPPPTSQFLSALTPSYLSLDISGRVIRMDSFSKIIAPGCRTGFVTAPKEIVERFVRHQEVGSQNPSGFSMVALYKLLEEKWGHEGFLGWLGFIRAEYTRRRDIIVNATEKFVGADVARWTPPSAGMFFWITVEAANHPRFKDAIAKGRPEDVDLKKTLEEIEESIFLAAVKKNVLVARGSWFRAEKADNVVRAETAAVPVAANGHQNNDANGDGVYTHTTQDIESLQREETQRAVLANGIGDRGVSTEVYFRMTFAAAGEEQIAEAVRRFGAALDDEFGL